MEPNQAGITALITAYSRAYHATHDTPVIFDDFLADRLFTSDECTYFDRQLATLLELIDPGLAAQDPDQDSALALVMQLQTAPITLGRSRYCEDALEKAILSGVDQYVILGAGFDTFAFRHPELTEKLQVFEVDHPFTQNMKSQRISAAGWNIPGNLHFSAMDFSKDNLSEVLLNSGFDPAKKSFWNWLGVTYYLPMESIEATLKSIKEMCTCEATIVFDYIDSDSFIAEKASRCIQLMQTIARQAGEPILSGFDPDQLPFFLQNNGFTLMENLNQEKIEARYFSSRHDQYHAVKNIHFAMGRIE